MKQRKKQKNKKEMKQKGRGERTENKKRNEISLRQKTTPLVV